MTAKNCILCVGRNRRNQELLSEVLNKVGYAVEVALRYEDVMARVETNAVKLVLLDVTGFDQRIWLVCQALRSHTVPFFIIAASSRTHLPDQYSASGSLAPLLFKPLRIRPLLSLIAHTLQLQP
ncbi:MAG: hypothetical protein AAF716_18535 [Cyanobacteria bacterium P01_D01_bin.1]